MTDLPSWNDGPARTAILAFVRSVTEPGSGYVPPEDRLATFDNDGTLWCEKPMYAQADFLVRRLAEMVRADPAKAAVQPWKAVVEHDQAWLADLEHHVPELVRGVGEAYAGITTEAFEEAAATFFATAVHPTLGRRYAELTYTPMRELLDLLAGHGFTVYLCTAGGRDFVRPIAHEVYGVPREHVIGSGTTLEVREDGQVYRTAGVEQPLDEGPGKPVHIWRRTGRRPLLAGGNADGDVEMLSQARFALLVHHDDAEREFAYDSGAERALGLAGERAWTVVSMRDDFARVFDPR